LEIVENDLHDSAYSCCSNLDFIPRTVKPFQTLRWLSADSKVAFHKNAEGWFASPQTVELQTMWEEHGFDRYNPPCFSTLKEVRFAVSLDSDSSLSTKLIHPSYSLYQIGDLPLHVSRVGHTFWKLSFSVTGKALPVELAPFFPDGWQEFQETWKKSDVSTKKYATRKQAVQAAQDWLEEYVERLKS
jgi:hypothetical protein